MYEIKTVAGGPQPYHVYREEKGREKTVARFASLAEAFRKRRQLNGYKKTSK